MTPEKIREVFKQEADRLNLLGHKGGHVLWEFANSADDAALVRLAELIRNTK